MQYLLKHIIGAETLILQACDRRPTEVKKFDFFGGEKVKKIFKKYLRTIIAYPQYDPSMMLKSTPSQHTDKKG